MSNTLNNMSSKSAMAVGVIGGFLLICTVGFFVLGGMYLKGDKTTTTVTTPTTVVAPTVNTPPTAGTGTITLSAIKSTDYYKGGKDAKITIVEFSDSECPFCKRFHTTMLQVMKEYGDKVKWVYKHAPLDSLHAKARNEANAMECAGELGGNTGFWKFTDRLYEVTPSNDGLLATQLPEIAKFAGLDVTKFNTCLSSGKHASLVAQHLAEAETAGMNGTPYAVVVSGDTKTPINGAYSFAQMKSIIDSLIK